jgi:peptide/nickel transport system substrate-binding protein
VVEGINESVRIFLASKIDQYVVNEKISGIVNDFGAGVPSRFTPINAKSNHEEFTIGVKQIYQGAWNPVMGLTDSYSRHIWGIISDPATFKHPFTGETFPVRATWEVETAESNKKIDIPQEAKIWNPTLQKWDNVDENALATSKVTFNFEFSNWHNGEKMNMDDILHSLYFTIEWGTQVDENDKTFDTEYTELLKVYKQLWG